MDHKTDKDHKTRKIDESDSSFDNNQVIESILFVQRDLFGSGPAVESRYAQEEGVELCWLSFLLIFLDKYIEIYWKEERVDHLLSFVLGLSNILGRRWG